MSVEIDGRGIRVVNLTGRGARGADNYQLWLGAGNVGTLDDFINDMALRADINVVYTAGLSVPSRAALTAVTGAVVGDEVRLTEAGRWGDFEAIATNAAAVTADPGQGVYVAGSGVTWRRINREPLYATWFGVAVGGTEAANKSAYDNAIAYMLYINGGKLIIPGQQHKGRVIVPPVAFSGATGVKMIHLKGELPPSTFFGTVGSWGAMPQRGSIIQSDTVGGYIIDVPASGGGFSGVHLIVEDIGVRSYDNPNIGGIGARYASQFSTRGIVYVDAGVFCVDGSLPTHDVIGIETPEIENGAVTLIGGLVVVTNYFRGWKVNEHFLGEYPVACCCLWAVNFKNANHPSKFIRFGLYRNQVNLASDVGVVRVSGMLAIEHANPASQVTNPADLTVGNGWQVTAYDFYDTTNAMKSTFEVEVVLGNSAPVDLSELKWNGGAGIHVYPAGESPENPGYHSITNPAPIASGGGGTNLTWTGGSGAGSGLKIKAGVTFTASIAGTTLTVTSTPKGGKLSVNDTITGAGVTAGTKITALGTGTGGIGTYTVNNSQAISSEAMTAADATKLVVTIPGLFEFTMRGSYAPNATGKRQMILGRNAASIDPDIRPNNGAAADAFVTTAVRVAAQTVMFDEITVAGLQDSTVTLDFNCSALFHKRVAGNFIA